MSRQTQPADSPITSPVASPDKPAQDNARGNPPGLATLTIAPASAADRRAIQQLVTRVSEQDVLPHLSAHGQATYREQVIPGLAQTLCSDRFINLKAIAHSADGSELVGYAALRDGNYLMHLFIDSRRQGSGLGRQLLERLLQSATTAGIHLRASVNAVGFYRRMGFVETGPEAEFNGIRFVGMKRGG